MDTKNLEYPKGAEWRKWDLHIHSDASDGKMTCEQIVQTAIENDLAVIALTDHHTAKNIDQIRALGNESGLSTIAGIEFRTEYGSRSVHIVGLFPEVFEDYELDTKNLQDLVLNPLGLSDAEIKAKGRKRLSELKESNIDDEKAFKHGVFCVQVEFKKAADLIHELGGIVIPHAGSKDHSIEKEMRHEGKPGVTLYDSLGTLKQELFEDGYIDICEIASHTDDATFYLEKFNRPSIISSDAHKVSEIGRKFTWIKADPTFDGLLQVLEEPEARVIIEGPPPLFKRFKTHTTKYFKSVSIRPEPTYAGDVGKWFDNVQIEFNPELVAIIGNKGSGKSAIADILGLCTNSKREQKFSFLNRKRFRKKGYANNFLADLEWLGGGSGKTKNLMDEVDLTQPERAKYMPQGYFEELCNDIDSLAQFKKEINEVVFQHVPDELKLKKTTFESFLEHKSKVIDGAIAKLQSRLGDQNRNIIKLERMRHPRFEQELRNELMRKEEELKALKKPKTVRDPTKKKKHKDEKDSVGTKISRIDLSIKSLDKEIKEAKKKRGSLHEDLEHLSQIKREVLGFEKEVKEFIKNKRKLFEHIPEINLDEIIKITVEISAITNVVANRNTSMELLDQALSESSIVDDEGNEKSLVVRRSSLEVEKQALRNHLDKPNKTYQNYLSEKETWESEKAKLVGSKTVPGTITYLTKQIDYLKSDLSRELKQERSEREDIVRKIFSHKKEIIAIFAEIKEHVSSALEEHVGKIEDYPIQIVGELIISPKFQDKLLAFINKAVLGNYRGIEEASSYLSAIIDNTNFNEETDLIGYLATMIQSFESELQDGKSIPRYIDDQVEDTEGFYNYLFGLEYLDENYQLKLGDKSLETLSPGEKGALLLVFYLLLDKSEIPLILDQPEDNLDNQSVFQILVPFIRAAKLRRQIIMITHNPNLAVVADAEQIIRVNIMKEQDNDFAFSSGSIENPTIKKAIVDVLEGTMPAFKNRSDKYTKRSMH